jgi:glycosyltransferase involved in cell wall biosynthesis
MEGSTPSSVSFAQSLHPSIPPSKGLPGLTRPLRITYLITDLKIGGVPLHLHRLATRLPRDRAEVRVITLAGEGPVAGMLRRGGVPVQTCGAVAPWDVRALWRLHRLLRADPPDLLHAMLFHANVAARLVGPPSGVQPARIICEIQTVERERKWHLPVDNLTCRLCRCEVGNSPSVVAHLHERAHIPKTRLALQWGAVDVAAVSAAEPIARESIGLSAGEIMLLWTGRLDPVKGFEEMLGGFARACAGRPVKLVLVGEGAYRPTVERLIAELNLEGRVLLLGERQDVPRLLKAADLFLFPSRTEGLPNALLEAMAAGLPIVATDVPGCRDLIQDGRTGLLVRAESAEDIARGLTEVLNRDDRGKALGGAARDWVSEHADARVLADRWMGFYERIAREAHFA